MKEDTIIKNWLIRTKQHQILGPLGKGKLKDFISNGSLSPDDQITSGNGYWFLVKERDLIDKYIFGDVPQSFNMISEAETIVAIKEKNGGTLSINPTPRPDLSKEIERKKLEEADDLLPDNGDLEYPDMISGDENVAVKEKINPDECCLPSSDDLAFPDMGPIPTPKKEDLEYPDLPPVANGLSEVNISKNLKKEDPVISLDESIENGVLGLSPSNKDLEYPDIPVNKKIEESKENDSGANDLEIESTDDHTPKKIAKEKSNTEIASSNKLTQKVIKKLEIEPKAVRSKESIINPKRNDRFLFYLLILICLVIAIILFRYREILSGPLN